jgi:hypothetical protein
VERIAVVFGIPLTRVQFRVQADGPWDYGRAMLRGRSVEEAFDSMYAPICAAGKALIEAARECGHTVYEDARLADLAQAFESHDVIVLVAHWRGSSVEVDDIEPGWFGAFQNVGQASPLALVAAQLPRDVTPGDGAERAILAAALNRTIESGSLAKFLPWGIGTAMSAHQLIVEALYRDVLDEHLVGTLSPGNQLELADGLHALGAFNSMIADSFRGTVDLSCCTSTVLGSYLRLERGEQLDVIMGDQHILPVMQLQLLREVIVSRCYEPGSSYAAVRRAIARALEDWHRR